jgi:hypothetical protein
MFRNIILFYGEELLAPRWACITYGAKTEVHTEFWWGDLREGDHLGDPGIGWRIILK